MEAFLDLAKDMGLYEGSEEILAHTVNNNNSFDGYFNIFHSRFCISSFYLFNILILKINKKFLKARLISSFLIFKIHQNYLYNFLKEINIKSNYL